jgi:hypothetical protein
LSKFTVYVLKTQTATMLRHVTSSLPILSNIATGTPINQRRLRYRRYEVHVPLAISTTICLL